jgi:hypothetical protein
MVTVSDQICCKVTKSDRIKIGRYLRSWQCHPHTRPEVHFYLFHNNIGNLFPDFKYTKKIADKTGKVSAYQLAFLVAFILKYPSLPSLVLK